jgi:hypothetical protein
VSEAAVRAGRGSCAGWCAVADPTTVPQALNPTPPSSELAVEQRFAIVPEWMLDAEVSDAAFRLYAVLARYGNTSGVRMPGRALLARRLRKSVDTVDRSVRELSTAGVLEVERRQDGSRHLTNRYHLRTLDPASSSRTDAAIRRPEATTERPGGRRAAAPPGPDQQQNTPAGRTPAATPRRTDAATVAAAVRPDPDVPTDTPPPTPANQVTPKRVEEDPNRKLLDACGITDLDAYATQVQGLRRQIGQPSVRWTAPCLLTALQLAVKVRSWPAPVARHALLLVAADPRTRSPMRLAEAGPWWDHTDKQTLSRTPQEQAELDGLEHLLADCDDRALLQAEARRQLAAEGEPVTRLTVARRAARLLENQTQEQPAPTATDRTRTGNRAAAATQNRISA